MPKDRPDFINVRLSDDALQLLGGDASVTASNAHWHYTFRGNAPVEVVRAGEWSHWLSRELLPDGSPMFQTAEVAAPAAADTDHLSSEE